MTLRKVVEFKENTPCRDPGHNPPNMIVLDPGMYEWTCPGCGQKQYLTVPPRPTL